MFGPTFTEYADGYAVLLAKSNLPAATAALSIHCFAEMYRREVVDKQKTIDRLLNTYECEKRFRLGRVGKQTGNEILWPA